MTSTHIPGSIGQLPLKKVRLPLKYEAQSGAEEAFAGHALTSSGIFENVCAGTSTISKIRWGLRSDLKNLSISPILTNLQPSELQFQSIAIELPHRAIAKSTVLFQLVYDNEHDRSFIVIDVIDIHFLFITLVIDFENFIMNAEKNLSLDNFDDWAHISVPYSFELKSPPSCIRAFSENDLILSLEDCSLLHFRRKSLLTDFEIFKFTSSLPHQKGIVGKFFSTHASSTEGSTSFGRLADIQKLDRSRFLALSREGHLYVYDILGHKLQNGISLELEGLNGMRSSSLKSGLITKLSGVKLEEKHLFFLIVSPDNRQNVQAEECSVLVKAFEFHDDTVLENPNFSFEALLSGAPNTGSQTWIQDYHVTARGSRILHSILGRSSGSCQLYTYQQNALSGSLMTRMAYENCPCDSLAGENLGFRERSHISSLIWNSGRYDLKVITSSIGMLDPESIFESAEMKRFPIRKRLEKFLELLQLETGIAQKLNWQKLYLLCEEHRRRGQEHIAFSSWGDFLVSCQANGLGVFRKYHFFEKYERHVGGSKMKKILSLLKVRSSHAFFRNLRAFMEGYHAMEPTSLSAKCQELFSSRISQDEIGMIVGGIDSEVISLITDLTRLPESIPSVGSCEGIVPLDSFTLLFAFNTFKTILEAHRCTLLEMSSLLLLCEPNTDIVRILGKIHRYLVAYTILDQLFLISFTNPSDLELEEDSIGRPEYSLFWTVFGQYNYFMDRVKRLDLNSAFDFLCQSLTTERYSIILAKAIFCLIDCGKWSVAQKVFGSTLNVNSPIQKFTSGILCLFTGDLKKSRRNLGDYDVYRSISPYGFFALGLPDFNHPRAFSSILKETPINDEIIVLSKASYLHGLSTLCKACSYSAALPADHCNNLLKEAVEYEVMAISSSIQSESGLEMLEYQKNLFALSMQVQRFEGALEALDNLSTHIGSPELKTLAKTLINALIASRNQHMLFDESASSFLDHHRQLIDSILFDQANEDLVLWRALKTYELLYSWRLRSANTNSEGGDRRGACEALYTFITRFRLENESLKSNSEAQGDYRRFKLKILELYMIILNTMRSFRSNDEKWIRIRCREGYEVVDLSALNSEYLTWLELMDDGSMLA